MKNFLNSVLVSKPRSNTFDLSHDVKMSGNMGYLYPSCIIDCVPGDSFQISCEALFRFSPLVAPVMHRFNATVHYFFVPKRLLWDHWEQYITNTEVSGAIPAAPKITINNGSYGPLHDYLGLPDPGAKSYEVSPMPMAAYNLIYNEYYRDQNLITEKRAKVTDGDNTGVYADFQQLWKRAWEHDYFTAALPWAQKGDAVEIPISGDVVLKNISANGRFVKSDGSELPTDALDYTVKAIGAAGVGHGSVLLDGTADTTGKYDPNGTLEVQNADTSINDLRKAYALQRFLEKLARGGSRLTEFIRTMFGVTSSDARLQRPEYITGVKSPVVISEVLNTTGTTEAAQGSMAGHGASVISGKYGSYFCEEHGYIMGILSIMPTTAYQQGVPKHFLKINESEEHFLPDFANIGEQEILNKEVYVQHTNPDSVFGYIPRYGEYKFEQNRVAGQFKTTLDYWHAGRIFEDDPALNADFVESDPTHRIFAVTDEDEDKMLMHVYNRIIARRLMPKYGTPTF